MSTIFDHLFAVDEWVKTHKWPSMSALRWMMLESNAIGDAIIANPDVHNCMFFQVDEGVIQCDHSALDCRKNGLRAMK